jgi:hypothetical protein
MFADHILFFIPSDTDCRRIDKGKKSIMIVRKTISSHFPPRHGTAPRFPATPPPPAYVRDFMLKLPLNDLIIRHLLFQFPIDLCRLFLLVFQLFRQKIITPV